MFHPAALLLAWLTYALALQWLVPHVLFLLTLAVAGFAAWFATDRSHNLFKRSRWLLVTLGLIYLFATPGVYLPGIGGKLGLTIEGVEQGLVQVARLVALLASLAILHQWIGTHGMIKGLHWLLSRFAWGRATVVRLILVLDYVEERSKTSWRDWLKPSVDTCCLDGEDERFFLVQTPFRWMDGVVVSVAMTTLALLVIRT